MTNKLRENLPPLPERIKSLPIDERGYPVPYFVEWIDGKPEFRIADSRKLILCVEKKLCWLCGQRLGTRFTFPVGPMCGINRISSEPPSHRECAEFGVRACPFLTMPKMIRREAGLPEGAHNPGGLMIRRNPGVTLLWHTRDYKLVEAPPGFLFRMGEPFETGWYAEGRPATRAEIDESVETGLPFLLQAVDQEPAERRGDAMKALEAAKAIFTRMLPAA